MEKIVYNLTVQRASEITSTILAFIVVQGAHNLPNNDQVVLNYLKTILEGKELAFAFYTTGKICGHAQLCHSDSELRKRFPSHVELAYRIFKETRLSTIPELAVEINKRMFSKEIAKSVEIEGIEDLMKSI